MTISVGEKLPEGTLMRLGEGGPEPVALEGLVKGRKIALFGLPGAFTSTCSNAHLPSFTRNAEAIKAKGVDEIICISVNDPWVVKVWDDVTGASGEGVTLLADADASLTLAMGLEFSAPPVGFVNRTRRFAAIVEDGTVTWIQEEEKAGVFERTSGEELLAAL